ncbi:MAG: hypothetical protein HY461_02945 [Parcubacteria group bacterium]|nr:hypothetical protein [Parcubacteria group bacterium]
MQVDLKAYESQATAAFRVQLRKETKWIAENCWVSNLETRLNSLNEIIAAGNAFGVTAARQISEGEIKDLVGALASLRVLEMKDEAYGILTNVLVERGVDRAILA